MDHDNLNILFSDTKSIIEQHIQETKVKGEDFNIFYVLAKETNETKTHSAMLVALLNPRENHYYDEKFLQLFLDEIDYDYEQENLKNVFVQAEYHLGKITENYESGGFIDILITFPSGKTIAIENKIYAGDQPKQLHRYSLFNKGNSALIYLNLFGNPPSTHSLYKLTDEDFSIISYSDEILDWLEKCLAIVKSGSIIESSIKQYQILIKRLTHTMENHLEHKLNYLILQNLEEAKYIYSHYQKAIDTIKEALRLAVYHKLKAKEWEFDIHLGNHSSNNYSQIWLDTEENRKSNIRFGIETFSGKGNNKGRLFVGILNKGKECEDIKNGDRRLNSHWPVIREIKTKEKNPLNLASSNILAKLSSDADYFDAIVNEIVEQTKLFINDYNENFYK